MSDINTWWILDFNQINSKQKRLNLTELRVAAPHLWCINTDRCLRTPCWFWLRGQTDGSQTIRYVQTKTLSVIYFGLKPLKDSQTSSSLDNYFERQSQGEDLRTEVVSLSEDSDSDGLLRLWLVGHKVNVTLEVRHVMGRLILPAVFTHHIRTFRHHQQRHQLLPALMTHSSSHPLEVTARQHQHTNLF